MQVEVPKKWRLRADIIPQVREHELLKLKLSLLLGYSLGSIYKFLKENHIILTSTDALGLISDDLKLPPSALVKQYDDKELNILFPTYKGHKRRQSPYQKSRA